MGGWERVRPQWVRHAEGYEVYGNGRNQIAYEDQRGTAVIAAERLVGAVQLDPVDIAWVTADGTTIRVAEGDRALILERTVEGLTFMGTPPVPSSGTAV